MSPSFLDRATRGQERIEWLNDSSPGRHSPHAADRRAIGLIVVALIPDAEPLVPRTPFEVLRAGPVPSGGIGTTYVKSADLGAVVEQHRERAFARQVPVLVAVRIELFRLVQGLLP